MIDLNISFVNLNYCFSWIQRLGRSYPILLIFFLCSVSCQNTSTETDVVGSNLSKTKEDTSKREVIKQNPTIERIPKIDSTVNTYSWLEEYQIASALINQIPVPNNYQRTPHPAGSFADWLRFMPLKEKEVPVRLYNNQLKGNQRAHYRVIDIPTGKRDLQQCADAVMRVRAEYLFSKQQYADIQFNYTSGDAINLADWQRGKRPKLQGNRVVFTQPSGPVNKDYSTFYSYLQNVFTYAGTASLSKEMKVVSLTDLQIGDVFIKGGFPGHAVIVMDVAIGDSGKKLFLLAQSYMPAQDMHILKNPNDSSLSPWYDLSAIEDQLITPEWTFTVDQLKRFDRL